MSITEGGKEGTSKVIASSRYLEEKLRECSKEEGVILADSVETVEVGLRTVSKGWERKKKREGESAR